MLGKGIEYRGLYWLLTNMRSWAVHPNKLLQCDGPTDRWWQGKTYRVLKSFLSKNVHPYITAAAAVPDCSFTIYMHYETCSLQENCWSISQWGLELCLQSMIYGYYNRYYISHITIWWWLFAPNNKSKARSLSNVFHQFWCLFWWWCDHRYYYNITWGMTAWRDLFCLCYGWTFLTDTWNAEMQRIALLSLEIKQKFAWRRNLTF